MIIVNADALIRKPSKYRRQKVRVKHKEIVVFPLQGTDCSTLILLRSTASKYLVVKDRSISQWDIMDTYPASSSTTVKTVSSSSSSRIVSNILGH